MLSCMRVTPFSNRNHQRLCTAVEGECQELKLAVPGYSRHLAALAKEKNKEKGSKSG